MVVVLWFMTEKRKGNNRRVYERAESENQRSETETDKRVSRRMRNKRGDREGE